jgi:hypothetical protein
MCAAGLAGTEIATLSADFHWSLSEFVVGFTRFLPRFLSAARELKKQSDRRFSDANCRV